MGSTDDSDYVNILKYTCMYIGCGPFPVTVANKGL